MAFQFPFKVEEIIDFAVKDDPNKSISVAHVLMTQRRKIDDGQPPVSQVEPHILRIFLDPSSFDLAVRPDQIHNSTSSRIDGQKTLIVGSAMAKSVSHFLDPAGPNPSLVYEQTRNPAHLSTAGRPINGATQGSNDCPLSPSNILFLPWPEAEGPSLPYRLVL